MIKTLLISFALLFLLVIPVVATPNIPTPISTPPNSIAVKFLSQNNQQISSNCYNVQVFLYLNSSLTRTFSILIKQFYLFESGDNLTVSNTSYWIQSNATLTTVLLFPNNPITLEITFANFCLIPVTNLAVYLFYDTQLATFRQKIFP